MKMVADQGRYGGTGICESIAADYFELGDDGPQLRPMAGVNAADAERIQGPSDPPTKQPRKGAEL